MSIATKLEFRQAQTLVMTPQLQQAIKLLQLSNLELIDFVDRELERNPLLERAETDEPAGNANGAAEPAGGERESRAGDDENGGDGDWVDLQSKDNTASSDSIDADPQDIFPDGEAAAPPALHDSGWSGISGGAGAGPQGFEMGEGDAPNVEAYVAAATTLRAHLSEQLLLSVSDPAMRLIGQHLIDTVDETGYLQTDLETVAEILDAPLDQVEETLKIMQGFDPSGVFARDLRECLSLQLKEIDRCDPAMAALIENLQLLAAHDLPGLKRICKVSDEDLREMIAELKRLNPKPGLVFGAAPTQPIVPDVLVQPLPDGSWYVELNSETLPRVLVDQAYYAKVSKSTKSKNDKSYLSECFHTANWLVKSLDQRARTILKVAEEIVRQQDGFFTYGVRHLKPLNLKTVADAIQMHESTVSRVTANKYMATNRGLFELKYFFTSSVPAAGDGDAHSSESVRHRIKEMIDSEHAQDVLSDDKIVEKLRDDGIDIARRTVAKYRETLRIPSSVQRRRIKRMALRASA
ncbi:RNA polymerase factor sigma-54 [Methyloligella sp. 2.7D]|uniref:RNA polymerase factor sigma-54 n=1 Tax=unclassified Methyloligella TaxID=2625955 RepID=UPI00157E0CFE|nr:RNA polymerase factor sigma-54 [Methyloligella sp. GL2]QKP76073.1 RNA polymerase factor sigma-54 [Methyloligella sp. GL2]